MTAPYEKLLALRGGLDPGGMLDLVAAMPSHLESGFALGDELARHVKEAEAILVVGMGGSAIAGDLIRSYFGPDLRIPIHVCRNYDAPKAWSRDALVLFSSYSGNTAETLSVYDSMRGSGNPMAAITSGGMLRERCERDGVPFCTLPSGMPPRATIGLGFGALARVAAAAGAGRVAESECGEAVASLAVHAEAMQSAVLGNVAADIAQKLYGKYPVLYACNGLLAEVALRWKTQINENSKLPAHVGIFPEISHNEICGWDGKVAQTSHVVILEDEDDHPGSARQRDLTIEAVKSVGVGVTHLPGGPGGRMARLLRAVMAGDFVSVYLAYLGGVDPTPVDRIATLKAGLAQGS
jgi:glucose/mannose-6-phosphate isomerase